MFGKDEDSKCSLILVYDNNNCLFTHNYIEIVEDSCEEVHYRVRELPYKPLRISHPLQVMSPNTRKQKTSEAHRKTCFSWESTNAAGKLAREKTERHPIDVGMGTLSTRSHFRNHSPDYLKRITRKNYCYETDSNMTKGPSSVTSDLRSGKNRKKKIDPVTPGPANQSQGQLANSPEKNEEDDIFALKIVFSDVEITLPIDFKISFVDKMGTIAKDDMTVPFLFRQVHSKVDKLCDSFPKSVGRELKQILEDAPSIVPTWCFSLAYKIDDVETTDLVISDIADMIHSKLAIDHAEDMTVRFDLDTFLRRHKDVYKKLQTIIEDIESVADTVSKKDGKPSRRSDTVMNQHQQSIIDKKDHPSNISFKKNANDTDGRVTETPYEKEEVFDDNHSAITEDTRTIERNKDSHFFRQDEHPSQPDVNQGTRYRLTKNMRQQMNRLADIPMRVLDIKHVPTRPVCDRRFLTESQRFSQLSTLASLKIPDERKRNPTIVNACDGFDEICVLGWYENFSKRGLRNGIYVPPLSCYHKKSFMGMEWESGFCPPKIYEKAQDMDAAILADLRYTCAKNCTLMSILTSTSSGYQTLKNILVRYCPVLKEGGIADQSHLTYTQEDTIPRRVRRVHEYVLQNMYLGQIFTPFQQFMLVTSNLPARIKALLEDRAKALITADTDCDISGRVPFEITLEQCATWIMSEIDRNGYSLNRIKPKTIAQISTDDFVTKYIAALRTPTCWGCGKSGHTLNECPTHCITARSNLVDKSKIIVRELRKRRPVPHSTEKKNILFIGDNPANTPTEEPTSNVSPQDPLPDDQHSHDVLVSTDSLPNSQSDNPTKIADLDEHLIGQIAADLISEHKICSLGFDAHDSAFDYDDDCYEPSFIRTIGRDAVCLECGSHDHHTHDCPHLSILERGEDGVDIHDRDIYDQEFFACSGSHE